MALKRAVCVVKYRTAEYLLGLLGLLGQKYGLDVGQYTTLGDGHAGEQFVQLLVVTDGQLQVTRDDPGLLVVAGSVSCQLQNLGCQVLHDGGQVHWSTSTDTFGIVALSQVTMDPAHWELESSTGRSGLCLSLRLSTFTTSRHVCCVVVCSTNRATMMAKRGTAAAFISAGTRAASRFALASRTTLGKTAR